MALHFNSIAYAERDFVIRLDSKYYQLQEELKNFNDTADIKMTNLGEMITGITDGEHAGQIFVKEGILFLKNLASRILILVSMMGFTLQRLITSVCLGQL